MRNIETHTSFKSEIPIIRMQIEILARISKTFINI